MLYIHHNWLFGIVVLRHTHIHMYVILFLKFNQMTSQLSIDVMLVFRW